MIDSSEDDDDVRYGLDDDGEDNVTIKSLPSELLLVILDFASPPGCQSVQSTRSRYSWLRSTSIVCKQFTRPSQALLYSSITISNSVTATKWLASPLLGMYATRELDLVGVHAGPGLSGTTATRIISKAVGVRWLRLSDFKRLSCKLLASDSLRYLDTLVLQTPFPDKAAVVELINLPFRLRTLHVYNRAYEPRLLEKILETSRGSLTSLQLSITHSAAAYPGLLAGFPAVAPTLKRLELHHSPPNELIAMLALCPRLEHIQCHPSTNIAMLLDTLPQDVRLYSLEVRTDFNTVETLRLLGSRLFGRDATQILSKLRHLRVTGIGEYELYMMGQRAFVEQVQDRGIKLELEGGELSSNWAVQMWRPDPVDRML
ncbi:hypothetical protein OIV83_005397 [Microbotryomycetes sp. JL201]|nr:hypothetical protein OIV83_005397 [Microbotryomycetes sp. JL201]